MKKSILVISVISAAAAFAQDHIESHTHNTDFRGARRTMQYRPGPDGSIVTHNGNNLYTRALYGGNTLWRLETSDMPIFAAYHKSDNRNIHFIVETGDTKIRLDSVADCTATYRGGVRTYSLSDPAWGKGTLELTVVAAYDSESGLWRIKANDMPKGTVIYARTSPTVKVKLNRSGDIGADPYNCFAPDPSAPVRECSAKLKGKDSEVFIKYFDRNLSCDDQKDLKREFDNAMAQTLDVASQISIHTPDSIFNTLGPNLSTAADGIYDGQTYLHGAVGWRMPLSGWRGAYTGDFLGWHDRARTHFNAYASSQVNNVPPIIPHPTQDPDKNLARSLKKWGTQMYSDGYICRNPGKNNVMHHYDMNLCYIDELLWHLQWTADSAYAREIWPVIKASLEWEKRNFNPGDDGLYDAYCCIWASDALYYNSGAVTHSSAYNHRANLLAAKVAALAGEDPTPYRDEAEKIRSAVDSVLWMPDKGVWAEFRDFMGEQKLHTHPALWTVYHAIDGDIASPHQAYSATAYIDSNIPHIPVRAEGIDDDSYYTLSTSDWLPYSWSINNVAFAEVYNTALAYWQAGRHDEASKLLKSAMLDGMFMGKSPGNIGQISFYDAARGECYRDFADPVGVLSRAVVQGLYGFSPRLLEGNITLRPGFPSDWDHASITHADFDLAFRKETENTDSYYLKLKQSMTQADSLKLILNARSHDCRLSVNGRSIPGRLLDPSTPYATYQFTIPADATDGLYDMSVTWGAPVEIPSFPSMRYADIPSPLGVEPVNGNSRHVDLSSIVNANIPDIFHNEYLSPRSPYTTLQIPVQGIGEWCHPADTAYISDKYLRSAHRLALPDGTSFCTLTEGPNIAYVSLFDNYPDSITIPLSGNAKGIALLMAGSTNHMQVYTENASVTITYEDGTTERLSLVPPYNWAPIEQDYFTDGKAFVIPTPRQTRVAMLTGETGTDLGSQLDIKDVYGRHIPGGAANVLWLPLDPVKTLESMTLTAHANEVVIGLIAASLIE